MRSSTSIIGRIGPRGVKMAHNAKREPYAQFRVHVRRERRKKSRIDRHNVIVTDPHIMHEILAPNASVGTPVYVVGQLQYQSYQSDDGGNHRKAFIKVEPGKGFIQILDGTEGELL